MLNPAQFRLLLAGPRVARLLPFFQARGYVADACTSGSDALELMQQAPRHLLLLELDLEDMLCADLLMRARQKNLAGAVLLIEDPAKSGLIVSTLVRGVDGYVATPPDEAYLFRVVERQLLAQWALAQGAQSAQDAEDKARADRLLQQERAKVTELVRELGTVRGELADLKKKKKGSSEAPFESAATLKRSQHVPDERTSPVGFNAPPPGSLDPGFADGPLTRPGDPTAGTSPKDLMDETNATIGEDDLFLALDDGTGSTQIADDAAGTRADDDDDDLLNLDD